MNHRAGFLGPEIVRCGACDVKIAGQMHADDAVPIVFRHLVEDAVAQDAGDVHHAVDLPEGIDRLLDHGLGVVPIGDGAAIGDCFATHGLDLVDSFLRRAGVAALAFDVAAEAVDDNSCAFFGAGDGDLLADAAACAVHEDDFAL